MASLLRSAIRRGLLAPSLRRSWSTISRNDTSLTVHALSATFPYVWLRDACQSPECIHPSTSQKLHRTSDIPVDIKPAPDGVKVAETGLAVEWANGHRSFYPTAFLARHASPAALAAFHRDVAPVPWDAAAIARTPDLFVPYASLGTPRGLLAALAQLAQYGLLFVAGVPTADTADATCALRALAAHFGELRATFYGPVWDVKNVRESRNIAYTNLDLGLHMDLLYFEHPPRFQILHCLRNRVAGGTSLFVDAFDAAAALRAAHPADYDVLAATPVAFHYINDGHHLHRAHRTLALAPDGALAHVNYSPPFQAPLPLATPAAFYPALARFAALLADARRTHAYTLREGDAVVFDNRRVLHARTAFQALSGAEGETDRWLKGCYLEADALMDRYRVLRASADAEGGS